MDTKAHKEATGIIYPSRFCVAYLSKETYTELNKLNEMERIEWWNQLIQK